MNMVKMPEGSGGGFCDECLRHGRKSRLKFYQVNLNQALLLCPHTECTYPLGSDSLDQLLVDKDYRGRSSASNAQSQLCVKKYVERRISLSSSQNDGFNIHHPANSSLSVTSESSPLISNNRSTNKITLPSIGSEKLKTLSASEDNNTALSRVASSTNLSTCATIDTAEPFDDLEKLLMDSLDDFQPSQLDSKLSGLFSDVDVQPRTCEPAPCTVGKQHEVLGASVNEHVGGSSADLDNWLVECLHQHQSPFKQPEQVASIVNQQTDKLCPPVQTEKLQSCAKYLQWENKDALCWLDVCLCLLVHNVWVQAAVGYRCGLVASLLQSYNKACALLCASQPVKLESSIGSVSVRTGGGQVPSSSPLMSCSRNLHNFEKDSSNNAQESLTGSSLKVNTLETEGQKLLDEARESIWQFLHPRLRCKRGNHESPVFSLPLLLEETSELGATSCLTYSWHLVCNQCGHRHHDGPHVKSLPTFPQVLNTFSMDKACFYRTCFHCKAPDQRMNMLYDRLPPCLVVHFVEGLHHHDLTHYDFCYDGVQYRVTGVVQYRSHPDHFVAWLRRPSSEYGAVM